MNKKQNFIFIFSILSFFIVFSHSLFSKTTQSSEIMRAMRDEITRSMNELKIEGLERPYFIEYLLKITSDYSINSKLGTIVYSNTEGKQVASLTTIVKVGSYKFDNSGFVNFSEFFGSTTDDDNENYINRCIPADIDYNMLRRELWLATDASYKNAAEGLTKKKVIIEDKIIRDTTWDFSMVKPLQAVDTSKIEEFNDEKYTNLLIELSNIFSSHSEILNSQVDVNYTPETIYYVNSEGTEYIKNTSFFALNIGGYSQREDGMPIADAYSVVCNKPSELPDKDSLIKVTNKIISNIKSSIKASVLEDPYSGPILFLGSASCELLSKHFANNLMVQRKTRSARGAFTIVDDDHPFQSKIGGRVLPTFMTVEDKPLLKRYKNINLLGYYTIDDEGVLAQDVTLVKDGYLKTLLSTRIPIKRVNESNGHNRDNNNPMYSNLIISSDETQQLSDKELKKYMLKLCKDRDLPYGIVVKNIISSNLISSLIAPISNDNILNIETFKKGICLFSEIYKIFPDGREEKIVGGTISGISVNTFKDIVKTGNNLYVYNFLMGKEVFVFSVGNINMNIKNFVIPATIIAPSLLIEDCEVQVSETDYNRTNILKSPLLDY